MQTSSNAEKSFDLSVDQLLAQARQETGLEHFGDLSFLPALSVLLDAVKTEAQLNAFGHAVVTDHTLRALRNRLWCQTYFEQNPLCSKRPIVAPVIIIGPHRSGTTRLQRMLATDARLQHLKTWEGINPGPRLDLPDFGTSIRYHEVKQMFDRRESVYPGVAAHPMHPDWPEEDMLLLNQSFSGFLPIGMYYVPSYYDWFIQTDKSPAYRYMADLLNLISATRGDQDSKRWILKNPQHMLDLDVLLKVFPDAKLIFTHRDPIKTVGSVMSLMWHYAVQHTDMPRRAQIASIWLDFCERMARHCMRARASIPQSQQLDIYYDDMNRDWRSCLRRVYAFCEMEWSAETEHSMAAWLESSERENLQGLHRYSLEDFGTTEQEVEARMGFVRQRYAIPYEQPCAAAR